MIHVDYTSNFVKFYSKLSRDLKTEIKEKIELFKNKENHQILKVHKLHGKLKNRYSFSVNYKVRIVFEFVGKNKIIMHTIGDHDIYK